MSRQMIVRISAAALALSAAAFVRLTQMEGYTERAVIPVPGDVPTFGFGSTRREDGTPVKLGDKIDATSAVRLSLSEIQGAEVELKRCVTAALTQGEYDSLVSLAYNVGAASVCKSTMVKLHNASQHEAACAEFDRWTFFQGRDCKLVENKCSGLVKRRAAERALCEGRA